MSSKRFVVRSMAFTALFCSAFLFGQSAPGQSNGGRTRPASSGVAVQEFPVNMRENVVAGKTRVGTKVEAKLTIATLVNRTVIPVGATFSGEVVESVAKSRSAPSRLAIRMDSVHWKKGSAPIKVYLTAWYYPIQLTTDGDQSNDSPVQPMGGSRRRQSSVTVPSLPGRLPGSDFPPGPSASVSENRAVMKDVESRHRSDGGLVLTSTRLNLKLDKTTTYVLATGDLMPGK